MECANTQALNRYLDECDANMAAYDYDYSVRETEADPIVSEVKKMLDAIEALKLIEPTEAITEFIDDLSGIAYGMYEEVVEIFNRSEYDDMLNNYLSLDLQTRISEIE